MVDIFMIVMTCVLATLLILASVYLLYYYSHEDDKGFGCHIICKIAIVVGMILAWAQVLMLPMDVSNNRGIGGEIDMKLFWFIVYIATAAFVLVIIPTLISWYEADPDWTCV